MQIAGRGLVCIAAVACVSGVSHAAPRACGGADFARKADEVVADFIQAGMFSGAVLVERDGKVALEKGYGLADREWNVPNAPDTKFRLGSVTKQFTAAAILQLAEQGRLSIDDPVSKYYADAPAAWSKVTIKHLLSHRSGIPSYTGIPHFFDGPSRQARTPEELIKLTRDQPLEFEPGSKFAYDNSGYILLGYVIEKASGQSYADYLKAHIFTPLGMADTGYDVTAQIMPKRASGYDPTPQGWANAAFLDMSVPYAAGSLYSTVRDLLAWERALFGGKVVSPASLKLMTTDWGDHYGFGLGIDSRKGHALIAHGGGINGFSTSLQRYPEDGVTSIVLANYAGSPSPKIAGDLASLCMGEAPNPPQLKLSPAALDRLAGAYASPQVTVTIVREGDHLLSTAAGLPPTRLYPKDERVFFGKTTPAEATFEMGDDGRPAAVVVRGQGPELRLTRQPSPGVSGG